MMSSLRTALLAAALLACGGLRGAESISIENATARPTFVANGVSAAYFVIKNTSAAPDRLLAAKSSVAKTVEVHTVIREGDVMKMRRPARDQSR
jgi:hypothetical protein